MKNIVLIMLGVALVAGGVALLIRPSGVEVSMPEYTNADPKFGFIRGFTEQNGMMSFLFDEAVWVTGEGSAEMPNGFKIVNEESRVVNFFIAPGVAVEIVDLTDEEVAMREVTLEGLQKDLIRDFEASQGRPFLIAFDGQGRVEKIQEQYVP